MTLATVLTYVLLALGAVLVALGALVAVRQFFTSNTGAAYSPVGPAPYFSVLMIAIGVASMATSAFISLDKTSKSTIAQAPSATPSASAPATTAVPVAPTTVSSSPGPTDTTTSASPTEAVAVSSPAPGSNVEHCDVFAGTASLSADKTLVIGVQNLGDHDKTTYLGTVNNWDMPGALAHWTGSQYFGSGDASVGEKYLVSFIVMPTSVVKAALAEPVNRPTWAVITLPAGSTVKQSFDLTRVSGLGPAACNT